MQLELKIASIKKCYKVVELLIKYGATINASNNEILEYASCDGHYKVVKILLENGAKVNHKNSFGSSALSWAIINNHIK